MRGVKSFAMVLAVRGPYHVLTSINIFSVQATSKGGKEAGIELIQPPAGSKPGDRVFFEGPDFESAHKSSIYSSSSYIDLASCIADATPLPQMNPKKKIFETVQPGFTTLENKEAAWVNPVTKTVHRIRTEKGVCVAPTLVGASLS